jgi:hypothetical protein
MPKKINMIGKKYGRLTVIKEIDPYIDNRGSRIIRYLCRCECGNEKEVIGIYLRNLTTQSCGCYNKEIISRKKINIIGKKFGRWLVIKEVEPKNYNCGVNHRKYLCRCECGNEKEVIGIYLRNGESKSCGCLKKEILHQRLTTHNKSKEKIFIVLRNMKNRCYNKNNLDYHNYGGRGIKICDEWLNDPNSFFKWAENNGYKKDLTIERINVNDDYKPNNCTFVNRRKQSLNRRKRSDNKSGYIGVRKEKGMWYSDIRIKYKLITFKYYKTKKEALNARNNYIRKNNLQSDYKIQEWID